MPKSTLVVLVIGILALFIASLFVFHITDSFFVAKQPESTITMDSTSRALELKIEDTKAREQISNVSFM